MSEYFKQWAQNLTHPSEVAKVILQAVTSDDPDSRYVVGKTTEEGKPVLHGCAVWSTDSTGKLAFLDNMLTFFIVEVGENGNFSSKDRELK
jgi:hypothetical protein